MIDLMIELGGRVARALDEENEDSREEREAAIAARRPVRPTFRLGGGDTAPTRGYRRSAR